MKETKRSVEDIEAILKGLEQPTPSPETTRRILDEAARALAAPARRISPVSPEPNRRGMRFWRHRLAMAAAIAVLLGGGLTAALLAGSSPGRLLSGEIAVLRNGRSERISPDGPVRIGDDIFATTRASFRLRDGSLVKLDRGARMTLEPRGRGERVRLKLDDGRAFMRVARARGRFMVTGLHGHAEALGTVFGVTAGRSAMDVSVLKGAVAVRAADAELLLSDGQSAQAPGEGAPVPLAINADQALLWAREDADFRRRPLADVLAWLEQNSSLTFSAPEPLLAMPVTIAIADESVETVLDALALLSGSAWHRRETAVEFRMP